MARGEEGPNTPKDKEGATGGRVDGSRTFKAAAASVELSVFEVRAGGV